MTEPVTPKADRRVIDGEVVNEAGQGSAQNNQSGDANARRRAQQRAEQADRQTSEKSASGQSGKGSKALAQLPAWLTKTTVWLISMAIVVAVLFYTRPDQDWQIEHINRLQTQVVQLHETNKLLVDKIEQQQKSIDQKIAEVLSRPENQPLVSQGDLNGLKSEVEQEIKTLQQQLQQQLDAIGQQAESKWDALAEKAQQALQPSEADLQGLKQFEETVQSKLGQVGEEINKLLDFKKQQESKPPETMQPPKPLNNYQIQQWIVEINTQWLLQGNAAQTQQQLMALEQAIGLSELADKVEVGRIIGEDLRDVAKYSDQVSRQKQQQKQWLAELKALVGQLPRPDLSSKTSVPPIADEMSANVEKQNESGSKMDDLLHKLSGLVSLKKRETGDELSSVESALQHDVLIQRLYLLIDRLEWALQVRSESDANEALNQISEFVALHFGSQKSEFQAVVDKFGQEALMSRKPLAIVSVNNGM
ncbi:hypothetical protein [Thiomicrorhabdus sp.]|uniref:hypothetical protein n=1 Tax=Thiomicrorhabdus sp. TaxID=2039724 RepID=UPI003563A9EC